MSRVHPSEIYLSSLVVFRPLVTGISKLYGVHLELLGKYVDDATTSLEMFVKFLH